MLLKCYFNPSIKLKYFAYVFDLMCHSLINLNLLMSYLVVLQLSYHKVVSFISQLFLLDLIVASVYQTIDIMFPTDSTQHATFAHTILQ